MRLLENTDGDEFKFTKDFENDDIPPYVILSHTWGADEEEVTFKDIGDSTGKHKSGYRKLEFCADQARQDGQTYFWVDTCCIDKSNNVELNTAVTSMFRWYQRATRCYVYLSDVLRARSDTDGSCDDDETWHSDFRRCRWLTRGWTLQELLAPDVVEFYDRRGRELGNKTSLERHICDVTGIPAKALRGQLLSSFSIEERFSWQRSRKTKKPEDQAYSLSGICDVSMIPIYGEGRDKAMARLRREIDQISKGAKHRDFSVPFSLAGIPEVQTFVAREKELEEIHNALTGDGSRRTVILHGLGGIGKTQLAVAYAKRHKDSYSAIFWLSIQDTTSIKQSFASVAKRILRQHPSARPLSSVDLVGNLDDVVEAVTTWLSEPENTRWLAIYDNYDNPKVSGNNDPAAVDLLKFLPDAYQGSVLVTTWSSQVKIGRCIPLHKLKNVCESVEILSSTSGREISVNGKHSLNVPQSCANSSIDVGVSALVDKLDGLPLALATAGAYLHQVTTSVTEYLRLYETSWLQLQESSPGLQSYDRTLYSTWQISIDRIRQQNELSARLLGLWAYFSNQDLWFELLRAGSSGNIPWIQELTANVLVFNQAIRLLCNYGLVEPQGVSEENFESGGYSIHSCVHFWATYVLNDHLCCTLARFAIKAIGVHVTDTVAAKAWVTQRRLLQHAERCSQHVRSGAVMEAGIEYFLYRLGGLFLAQSKLAEAEAMYQRALRGCEETGGDEHPFTLHTINDLGVLYADQGKLAKAEAIYQRALRGFEKVFGPEHIFTLYTVNNLGTLYADQGKLVEAGMLFQRALQGYEKALGPEHASTLATVVNLGLLYADQGKLAEAEAIYQWALRGFEKALGPEHTSTLHTVNNLGTLYLDQGKLVEAGMMFQRALQGYEKALGPEHASTLATVVNLGLLYANQGKLAEAEARSRRAIRGNEKAFGPEALTTPLLHTANNLGLLYAGQGKLAEAEAMFQRALRGYEKAFGLEALTIPLLTTVNNLGNLYADQGKLAEAEAMYRRALRGNEKALGAEHMSTLDTVYNSGNLYANQGKLAEAEAMYQRALRGYEKALGTEHTKTVQVTNRISEMRSEQVRRGNVNKRTPDGPGSNGSQTPNLRIKRSG